MNRIPLILLVIVTLSCGRDDGRTPLVVYSPHGRDLLQLFEATYEAAHPEIDLRTLDMGSQEALDRVRTEKSNPQADVWFGGPSSLFVRAVDQGLLTPYRPDWGSEEIGHDPDWHWASAYLTPAVIAYNTDALTADQAPTDWDDVLDPRWREKVLIRNPVASGTMRSIWGMILLRSLRETGELDAGWEWLGRLDRQTTDYPLNPTLLHQKLLRQEGLVTLWNLPDILVESSRGAPFGYVLPSSGTPVIEDAIAIVAGSDQVEAAKAFVDWVGSVEAQALAAKEVWRLPARRDLPPEAVPAWVSDVHDRLVVEPMDWDRLAQEGPAWMSYWDQTVKGRS